MAEKQAEVRESKVKNSGDTPTMRLFGILELIASQDRMFALQDVVDAIELPKPTVHRMLQQLEGAGMLARDTDGRHYCVGGRLRRLAEDLLLNDTKYGARRAVLRNLGNELGESCNLTALSGSEVLYMDRVETEAPLRFYLRPGSRVPVHCSASGKVLLAQMSPAQRRRLLADTPLESYTKNTITTLDDLEKELALVKESGYAFDNEEFLPGLFCVAVLVPRADGGRSNMAVATQAPVMRMTPDKALSCLPALKRAAAALAKIENQGQGE
ncbi:MAG: IclR family transcriptional regulator [Paenalcaligenes sp.]|uniref:IclR family transcriptional regulator n=1 Tax=Paenalcaligenes suwonensis TaxID=1202713 RepID=UPI00140D4698|nr:IclR family transcriptional regulator [Paenalcaligenes suwonensis]NHC61707.1 IclR family transcriptional regulator [Paenalcaligenes suwonensis]